MTTFLLFESASGYGLFEVTGFDEIGAGVEAIQQSITDIARFGKLVKLSAFKPFTSAANALEQINSVSESQVRTCMWLAPFSRRTVSTWIFVYLLIY
jgi:nucleolar protein 56